MTSALGKELPAISDMACQTVSDLLDLKHVTREIMEMILHAMELKACLDLPWPSRDTNLLLLNPVSLFILVSFSSLSG